MLIFCQSVESTLSSVHIVSPTSSVIHFSRPIADAEDKTETVDAPRFTFWPTIVIVEVASISDSPANVAFALAMNAEAPCIADDVWWILSESAEVEDAAETEDDG